MRAYEDAVDTLYSVPIDRFVAERTRLVTALRAAGEKDAAARLAKRGRPTTSAWVVNQLYRHSRTDFDSMLATAAQLRAGEREAGAEHRKALAALRHRAAGLLQAGGHGASDATLRRVGATLAAIAAYDGFEPDPPGALEKDRDAPGFDAIVASPETRAPVPSRPSSRLHVVPSRPRPPDTAAAVARAKADAATEARRLAEERAEARRREAEAARVAAERKRLAAALRGAEATQRKEARLLASLRDDVRAAEAAVAAADEAVHDLERRLRDLDTTD
jgi:hypothetical protein